MYEMIGRAVVHYGGIYIRRRYGRGIKIGLGVGAGVLAVAGYLATRNPREG